MGLGLDMDPCEVPPPRGDPAITPGSQCSIAQTSGPRAAAVPSLGLSESREGDSKQTLQMPRRAGERELRELIDQGERQHAF